jgi:acetyl-CoA synthetase
MDEDSYLWYRGRTDDVIKSAGYRIGRRKSSCLVSTRGGERSGDRQARRDARHDRQGFRRAAPGSPANQELIEKIQQHVRGRLAPYEYPREIKFIDALPATTGKVQRRSSGAARPSSNLVRRILLVGARHAHLAVLRGFGKPSTARG